jgi:hypothetical protein
MGHEVKVILSQGIQTDSSKVSNQGDQKARDSQI